MFHSRNSSRYVEVKMINWRGQQMCYKNLSGCSDIKLITRVVEGRKG